MNKVLHNRIKQAEAAAPRPLRNHSTSQLLRMLGHKIEINLADVPTSVLIQARDSKTPDKVLASWARGNV